MLNSLRRLSHQPPDSRSDLRIPRRPARPLLEFLHLLPNGFSTPTTTTLAFIKAGYNVAFEPAERAAARRLKVRLAGDGAKFFLILLKMVTDIQSAAGVPAGCLAAFLLGAAYAFGTSPLTRTIPNGRCF